MVHMKKIRAHFFSEKVLWRRGLDLNQMTEGDIIKQFSRKSPFFITKHFRRYQPNDWLLSL
jgi:hypothetical protein